MSMNETEVKKCRVDYLVTDIQKSAIRVDGGEVEAISNGVPHIEKQEIAILLATVKSTMITSSNERNNLLNYRKVDVGTEIDAMIKLLGHYDIEMLNDCFEDLKCFEIKKIFESDDPVMALHEFL